MWRFMFPSSLRKQQCFSRRYCSKTTTSCPRNHQVLDLSYQTQNSIVCVGIENKTRTAPHHSKPPIPSETRAINAFKSRNPTRGDHSSATRQPTDHSPNHPRPPKTPITPSQDVTSIQPHPTHHATMPCCKKKGVVTSTSLPQ